MGSTPEFYHPSHWSAITTPMKQNVLFLVHCEEMFRNRFPDPLFPLRLKRACRSRKYDRVIALDSMIQYPVSLIPEISEERIEVWNWAWGYDPKSFTEDEREFVIPAHGHEWTWIPPELREFSWRNTRVFVGGGFESECLQDWLDILDHLDVTYEKIRGYIYV